MNQAEKIHLAKQIMRISGIFTLLVAGLLVINFLQLKKYEPLESEALNVLVEQLKDDPRNDVLREEIRDFDLLVRKAYFTSTWQVRTGAFLMLFGAIFFAVSLKVLSDLRRKIEEPGTEEEAFLQARLISQRWLVIVGVLLFGAAFIASIFSTNYLDGYYDLSADITGTDPTEEAIEVVQIVELTDSSDLTAQTVPETVAQVEENTEAQVEEADVNEGLAKKEDVYGFQEFKKQHNSFRGPFAQGVVYHKNIPTNWDGAAGTNVVWKVAVNKPGYNSPIIWGDKLFLAGGDEESRVVMCYNRHTGELLWEKTTDGIEGSPARLPRVTDDTGLSAPTMTSDGYRVFAIFASGNVIAFDMDGNRVWARNLGVPQNHYGHSSSLLVWNRKLIIQYDTGKGGRMLALDTKTGATVWDVARDNNISWASPILVETDGKIQIVTNSDPNVAGHDVETGAEIWKLPVMMGEVGPSCAYEDGLVFANNEYASLVAINPEPGASVQWEGYDYLSEAASPVAYKGLLYLATSYGVLACYDTKTGEQQWEKDFGVTLYSSPMIAEDKLYIIDNSGVMHILKADKTGTIVSEPDLGEPSYAIPAFAEGKIYIRGKDSLYCIGN